MPDEFKKFVFISAYGELLALAERCKREGNDVIVCMVDNMEDAMGEEEEAAVKKVRWSQYNGILDKITPEKLFGILSKIENKDEWAVICDFNTLWKIADEVKKMGFRYGQLPTKLHYMLESDRNLAKRFVQKNYPRLTVADVEEFKSADDAFELLNESEDFWALKGNDTGATTVCPTTKHIELARSELIDALTSERETYEKGGFILEKQIRDGLEVCPQMIYNGGKQLAPTVDLEDKAFSDTDGSKKYGCAINIIVSTPLDCELNEIAFPKAADQLAKKSESLFYIDANLICKDGLYYFLEFCSGRMGIDCIFSECDMAGGVGAYFNALLHDQNPYERRFGAGVRGFTQAFSDDGSIKEGGTLRFLDEVREHLWFFGVEQKDGKLVNTKGSFGDSVYGIDLVAFTESSDDIEYAQHKLKNVVSSFSFNGFHVRKDLCDVAGRMEGLERLITPLVEVE